MPTDLGRLPVRDAHGLPDDVRVLLRPGAVLKGPTGTEHILPRWFYEVDSWDTALDTIAAPHFRLWEFMTNDVREADRFRQRFPRYVPCAVAVLAAALEVFRVAVGTYVHVAANGGYRSPAHQLTRHASRHCWGTAANIYRVGDDWLDSADTIRRYAGIARSVLPGAWLRPYAPAAGLADDHLHLDLGYLDVRPTEAQTGTAGDGAAA